MQAVCDAPVVPHQGQKPMRVGLHGREAGDAIDGLRPCLAMFMNGAGDPKNLSDSRPLSPQKVIELGTHHDLADLSSPMAFVHLASRAPVVAVGRRLAEKEL